jgi:beta-galactosidase
VSTLVETTPVLARIRLNLNREWKFCLGDCTDGELSQLDDSTWQPIGLPHTFDLPYFRTPEFYVGCGWYRRSFEYPAEWRSKRLFLEFDGAFQVAEVFVNGQRVGSHEGGYTGFSIDITSALVDGENILAVRVDNNWNPQLAPRAGEHIFSGGLYRDVHLVIANPLHVTWNGISITTPSVSEESATVAIKVEIANQSANPRHCRLVTTVLDDLGSVVAVVNSERMIDPNAMVEVDQLCEPIRTPKLWHPDHPHLYTVRTTVHEGDQIVDELDSPLGFRWFEWTASRGFFLNGKHLYLRGANAHQDHAGWGIAITQAACWRDVQLLKDAGFNFVRGAHYPHHRAFADACDRLGLIFWSENCFWGKGGFGPEGYWNASAYPVNAEDFEPFEEHCKDTLVEMIRINRNHPSILIWSMTNEAFFTYNLDRARALMSELVKLSQKLDPTRPAAIGGAQRGMVDRLGDVAGYNGDGARLFLDPGVPNMVSEYGAISKPHDGYEPFFGDLQSEEFPWRSGQAIWCAFDYGTIAGKQGLKGILHHNRLPKRSWYWYRNAYRHIPPPPWPGAGTPAKLRLTADKMVLRSADGTDDCQLIATVLDSADNAVSNCPPITLTIECGPGEFPTGPSITFESGSEVPVVDGQAAIALRSYYAGHTLIRATSPGLQDATIYVVTLGDPRFIPGETPPAAFRRYVPPKPSSAALAAMKNAVNVARDRPSRASSEAQGHPANHANDANDSTFWQAAVRPTECGEQEWYQVDLEGYYELSSIKLVFSSAANLRYVVALSDDGAKWTERIDRSQTVRTDATRNDVFDPGTIGRYVRLRFTSVPLGVVAGLRTVEIQGILSVR